MRFRRSNGGKLEISPMAAVTMQEYRQLEANSTEAGGILLGRLILNSQDIILDEATPPSRADRRSRFRIWRARGPAQRRVKRAWRESVGTCIYLGEWHTHPEDLPTGPSSLDVAEWSRLLKQTKGEHDHLIFIIVGRTGMRVWEGHVASGTIAEIIRTY